MSLTCAEEPVVAAVVVILTSYPQDGWAPLHVLCKRKLVIDDAPFIQLFSTGLLSAVLFCARVVACACVPRTNLANRNCNFDGTRDAVTSGAKAGLLTKDGASPLHYIVRRNPASEDEIKWFARSLDALLVRLRNARHTRVAFD